MAVIMGGQWGKAWERQIDLEHPFLQIAATKERAGELAKLNLPPGTEYMLLPFEGQWAWIFLSPGCEICCTPAAKVPRRSRIYTRIYTPAGAKAHSDRRLGKIQQACESGDDEST